MLPAAEAEKLKTRVHRYSGSMGNYHGYRLGYLAIEDDFDE